MLEGELDASSGCLEGPLSVIIEVVDVQAAGSGVQGKFKCSSGGEQTRRAYKQARLSEVRELLLRLSQILMMPSAV